MRKPATILLLLGLVVPICGLWAQKMAAQQNPTQQNPADSQRQSEPTTTLHVDVKLVNVFVTVTDEHGAPIGGLTKENFVLKEDNLEQKIAVFDKESALPLSIALTIDTSLSTRHDLPLEQASAKRFAHAILRPVDALSVYGFSQVARESTPGYTADLKRIDEAIDHIHLGESTAMYDAIYVVSRALDHRKGRKVIVLITDGEDVDSKIEYKEALRAAEEAEALIYSVIIVPIEASAGREIGGEHALIQLSEDTGGKYLGVPPDRGQGNGRSRGSCLSSPTPGRVLHSEIGILRQEEEGAGPRRDWHCSKYNVVEILFVTLCKH